MALQRGDVDIAARCLEINRALYYRGKNVRYKRPKSAKSLRPIPLSDAVVSVLQSHLDAQAERLAGLGISVTESSPLFDDGFGNIWHPDAFRTRYTKFLKARNLPHLPWRGTRHSFTTIARLEKNAEMFHLRDILGHEDKSTTEDAYLDQAEDVEAQRFINGSVALELLKQLDGHGVRINEALRASS